MKNQEYTDKKVRILFVTRSFPPTVGGMENFSFGLYHGLQSRSNVSLVANDKSYFGLPLFFLRSTVYSLLFGWQYDIIYCNDVLTSITCILAKTIYRKPLISTIYGLDIMYLHKDAKKFLRRILCGIYTRLFNFSKKRVDQIVAISQGTANLGKINGIKSDIVISPGINAEDFVDISQKENYINKMNRRYGKKKRIIYLGRLVTRKGAYWFLKNVYSKLKNKYCFIIIGDGEEMELIKNYKATNLLKKVYILGKVSNIEKQELLLGGSVLIMPNLKSDNDFEGFGIVALEAFMCGTPALAANIDGIGDAVKDRSNGLLYKSGDVDDCLKKLEYLLSGNFDSTNISRYVSKHYDYKIIAKRYLDFFLKYVHEY